MPHIHLETTADLPENAHIPDILEALVSALSTIETIDPKSIKGYHTLRSNWVMGEGAQPGFASCQIAVLHGRPEALRYEIADKLYAVLKEHFAESDGLGDVNLTLEVREMDRATYRK